MLAGNGPALVIVSPGRIAVAGLVDDPGKRDGEQRVLIEILGAWVVVLIQRRVVR